MLQFKRHAVVLCTASLLLTPICATQSAAGGRSFEECQQMAIARGIPARYSTKPMYRYERYKAAGTAINPKGMIARCMAGTG